MDATAKKLTDKMRDLQLSLAAYQREINAITTALEAIGMRVGDDDPFSEPSDTTYANNQPFRHSSLVLACKRILMDHKGKPLTKNQVEYLAAIGAYPFSTEDATNSVDVTLRRLADRGFCEVERSPAGNQYRFVGDRDEDEEGSEDAATTKSKRK